MRRFSPSSSWPHLVNGYSNCVGFLQPDQDTSWLELMWFFVWSTNCSFPVLNEGKYVTRGETTDYVLVEPTTVQLLKTFRYFISRIGARCQIAFVPHAKVKTTASTAKLSWSQQTPGLTSRPCHESFVSVQLLSTFVGNHPQRHR